MSRQGEDYIKSSGLSARLAFLAKDSVVYGLAGAISRLFYLITFPILTRVFTIEEFGVFDTVNTAITFLTILLVFGQDSAVARFYYEYEDESERSRVVSQSFWIQLLVTILSLLAFFLLFSSIQQHLNSKLVSDTVLWLSILQVPFTMLILFSQNLLKWTFERNLYLLISVGSVFVTMILLVLYVGMYPATLEGVLTVYLAGKVLFGILGFAFCRNWIQSPSQWSSLKELFTFAIPIGIVCAIGAFVAPLQRFLLGDFLDLKTVGLFAAGAKIAILINLPIEAFQTAWGPFSLSIHKEDSAQKTYVLALKVFCFLLSFALILQTALAPVLLELLATSNYLPAASIVFPIAATYALQAVGKVSSLGITISKKTIVTVYAYILFLAVFCSSSYYFTKSWGLNGVVGAMCLSYLIKTGLETWFSHRVYPISWPFWRLTILGLLTLIVGLFLSFQSNLLISAGICLVFPLITIAVLLNKEEFRIVLEKMNLKR